MKLKIFLIGLVLIIVGSMIPLNAAGLTEIDVYGTRGLNNFVYKDGYLLIDTYDGGGGLNIMDVRDPGSPKLVGHYSFDDHGGALILLGNTLISSHENYNEVLDVSDPTHPVSVNKITGGPYIGSAAVSGNYAYVSDRIDYYRFTVLDLSDPTTPTVTGSCEMSHPAWGMAVMGNYVFVGQYYKGMAIIDVSDPANPVVAATWEGTVNKVKAVGDKLYVWDSSRTLTLLDVSDPLAPQTVSEFSPGFHVRAMLVEDDKLYLQNEHDVVIYDISSPASPTVLGSLSGSGTHNEMKSIWVIEGDYLYTGGSSGLHIISIADPTAPSLTGELNVPLEYGAIAIQGDYAYTVEQTDGLRIQDISNIQYPHMVGRLDTAGLAQDVLVRGNYAYVADGLLGVRIIDVSDPTAPTETASASVTGTVYRLVLEGDILYALSDRYFKAFDVSDPTRPVALDERELDSRSEYNYIDVEDDYLFLKENNWVKIYDVSNPTSFTEVHEIQQGGGVVMAGGNFMYVMGGLPDLAVYDISDVTAPALVGECNLWGWDFRRAKIHGNFLYVGDSSRGLEIVDISNPESPVRIDLYYIINGYFYGFDFYGNYVVMVSGSRFRVNQLDDDMLPVALAVDRSELTYAADTRGNVSAPQTLRITQDEGGLLNWTITADQPWLRVNPTSGIGNRNIEVGADPAGLAVGSYSANITITSPHAVNEPLTVAVALTVTQDGQTSAPFGTFETPIQNSTVSSSIPVTGWVLDDVDVASVKIYREDGNTLAYIGDAVMVEGARPDVAAAYPDYPNNNKSGWGYMMLTNFLPGGNGVFNIHAVATDMEGNETTLGVRTITVDNVNAVKPFGAIDTPTQGGSASGAEYRNWGWTLTPSPNAIPTDGSTITVWVDGVPLGHPTYNLYRKDIAQLFPGYANSDGAIGLFTFDTSAYDNGVHSIAWSVTDDAGNTDGIGSRYFSIFNSSTLQQKANVQALKVNRAKPTEQRLTLDVLNCIPSTGTQTLQVVHGFAGPHAAVPVTAGKEGDMVIQSRELERVAVYLENTTQKDDSNNAGYTGYMEAGGHLFPLPIGSTLDSENGIFYWQPGPGFVGTYRFVFISHTGTTKMRRKNISIAIAAKH